MGTRLVPKAKVKSVVMAQDDSQDNSDQSPASGEHPVPIHLYWENSENVPILFANHFFVRLQDDAFLLTFGQMEIPLEAPLSDGALQNLQTAGMPVQTIARIAMTPERITRVIENLTTVRDIWLKRQGEVGGENGSAE